jgi:hypothetical protein
MLDESFYVPQNYFAGALSANGRPLSVLKFRRAVGGNPHDVDILLGPGSYLVVGTGAQEKNSFMPAIAKSRSRTLSSGLTRLPQWGM